MRRKYPTLSNHYPLSFDLQGLNFGRKYAPPVHIYSFSLCLKAVFVKGLWTVGNSLRHCLLKRRQTESVHPGLRMPAREPWCSLGFDSGPFTKLAGVCLRVCEGGVWQLRLNLEEFHSNLLNSSWNDVYSFFLFYFKTLDLYGSTMKCFKRIN